MAFVVGSGATASIAVNVDGERESKQKIESVSDALNNMSAGTRASIESLSGKIRSMSAEIEKSGVSARATAAAMRNVPSQITDIVTSLQGGQKPLTVLLQQGGQLKDMFGGIVPAARALGTAVLGMINPFTLAAGAAALLAFAHNAARKETEGYNKAIILSGNASGTSAGQMAAMAVSISKVVGTQGAAAKALADLAGTGRVAAGNLEYFGRVAVQMERTIGQATEKTAETFADLAKAPVEASERLNAQYRYLTAATYERIRALEIQGKTEQAGALAQKAYADAFDARTKEIVASLGWMERAWIKVQDVAKKGWDAILNLGRPDTAKSDLDKVSASIQAIQDKIQKLEKLGSGKDTQIALATRRAELEVLKLQQGLLQENVRMEQKQGDAAARNQRLDEARINFDKLSDQYLTRRVQMEREIALVREKGQAAGASQSKIDSLVREVQKKYADMVKPGIIEMEGLYRQEERNLQQHLRTLDVLHKNALLGDIEYEDKRYAAELAGLNRFKQIREDELAAARKANLPPAEIAGYRAKIAEINNQIELTAQKHGDALVAINHRAQATIEQFEIESMKRRGDLIGAFETEFTRKYADQMERAQRDLIVAQANGDQVLIAQNQHLIAEIEKAWKGGKIAASFAQTKATLDTVFAQFDNDMRAVFAFAESSGGLSEALGVQALVDDLVNGAMPDALRAIADLETALDLHPNDQALKKALEEAKGKFKSFEDAGRKAADTVSDAWDKLGDDMAQSLGKAVGKTGDALGGALKAYTSFNADRVKKDKAYEAERTKLAEKGLGGDQLAWKRLEKLTADYHSQSTQDALTMYSDMAGAAKGMFSEKTAAYKILDGIEKAMHAYRLAMNLAEILGIQTKTAAAVAGGATEMAVNTAVGSTAAVAAVANQGGGDPYTAFFRIAAMTAIMAALGFAVGGGGGASVDVAKERQKAQGTGTVLGDASAKSDSINKAIEHLAANSDITLTYTNQMLAALHAIRDSIKGMAASIYQSTGLLGRVQDTEGLGLGSDGGVLGMFKSSTTLTDQGFMLGQNKPVTVTVVVPPRETEDQSYPGYSYEETQNHWTSQSIAEIRKNGVGGQSYSSTHSEDSGIFGLFSSESDDTVYKELDPLVKKFISRTILGIADAVQVAGESLGLGGQSLIDKIDAFTYEFGNISLKGLSGQDLTDALNAVFSTFGDSLAEAVLPGFDAFQQVGEGYLETLVRVATGVEKAQVSMEALGLTAIKYTDIIDKQGDVFTEIARQSIVGAEGGTYDANGKMTGSTGIGSIIQTSGAEGDDLVALYKTLKGIQHQMTAVGIEGADVTVAMIKTAGGLEALKAGVQSYYDNFFSGSEKLAMMGNDQAAVFARLGVAMPTSNAEFRNLVNGIDRTTESGQKFFGALMADSEAFAAWTAAQQEAEATTRSLRLTEAQLMGDTAAAAEIVRQQREAELATMSASDAAIQRHIYELQDEADAAQAAADAAAKLKSNLNGFAGAMDKLKGTNSYSTALHKDTLASDMSQLTAAAPWITSLEQLETMTAEDFANYDEATRELILATLEAAGVVKDDFEAGAKAVKDALEVKAGNLATFLKGTGRDLGAQGAFDDAFGKVKSSIPWIQDFADVQNMSIMQYMALTPAQQASVNELVNNKNALDAYNAALQKSTYSYEEAVAKAGGATDLQIAQMKEKNALDAVTAFGVHNMAEATDAAYIASLHLTPAQLDLVTAYINSDTAVQNLNKTLKDNASAAAAAQAGWVLVGDVVSQATDSFNTKLAEIKANAATLADGDFGLEMSGSISHLQDYMEEVQGELDYWTEYNKHWQGGGASLLAAQTKMQEAQKALAELTGDYARYTVLEAQYKGHGKELLDLEKWYKQQQDVFRGNAEDMAALTALYERKRLDIINGGLDDSTDAIKQWVEGLNDWLRGNLLGANSPLSPAQRFAQAKAQYEADLLLAQSGDVAARERITQEADAYEAEAITMFGRANSQYQAIFDTVRAQIQDLVLASGGTLDAADPTVAAIGASNDYLMEIRDILAAQENLQASLAAPPMLPAYVVRPDEQIAELRAMREDLKKEIQLLREQVKINSNSEQDNAELVADAVEEGSKTIVSGLRPTVWSNTGGQLS